MPGVARKIIIFASVNGLIIQPGGWESKKAVSVAYGSNSIGTQPKLEHDKNQSIPHIEIHGLIGTPPSDLFPWFQTVGPFDIGLFRIASSSFLLTITAREQVAQIFGKPIYVIKDIAILPLSSQGDAEKAIKQVREGLEHSKTQQGIDFASSGSDDSETERSNESQNRNDSQPTQNSSKGGDQDLKQEAPSSVVKSVFETGGQYGRFASEWFTGKGSAGVKKEESEHTDHSSYSTIDQPDAALPVEAGEAISGDEVSPAKTDDQTVISKQSSEAAAHMIPRILRTVKLLFLSRSYYFSYDLDITRRLGSVSLSSIMQPDAESMDLQYFWNRNLVEPFLAAGFAFAIIPVLQGYVGQQTFTVNTTTDGKAPTEATKPLATEPQTQEAETEPAESTKVDGSQRPYLLTLISRRSVKRSGLRYLRRGIDDEGNCANSVETEQILSSPSWDKPAEIRSFVQVRGSIPLYFSQSPYSFKPMPTLHHTSETNKKATQCHFNGLQERYGSIHVVSLIDQQGGEKIIGKEYETAVSVFNESAPNNQLGFQWFDFHAECRGMKFENVQKLIQSSKNTLDSFGETVIEGQDTETRQAGVIRTNCMDCLDRTNVVQSAFAQTILQKELERHGLQVDFVHDPSTRWFNRLWADNGDAISRQYASTSALKGDYTRTRKRNYRGALNDFGLTLTRYYNNIINDYFSQTVIDILLGSVTSRVFDDFEATMMSADPGISVHKIRQTAIETCSRLAIQDPKEEFVQGWAMLSPAHTNTIRTLPFEDAILLLTDRAIYGCKLDANTEKLQSFERIDLDSINRIRFGTYITSTLTKEQVNRDTNVGIVVSYTPGNGSLKRVNTRSLSVSPDAEAKEERVEPNEAGLLSWLTTSRASPQRIFMAMKIIPDQSGAAEEAEKRPLTVANDICGKIEEKIGHREEPDDKSDDLIEQADIISETEARSRTGYLEQIGHSLKKFVWT